MTVLEITSNANPKFKWLKGIVQNTALRKASGYFVVEGRSLVMQTLRDRQESVKAVIITDEIDGFEDWPRWMLSRGLFKEISRLAHAEPVMALVFRPDVPSLAALGGFQRAVVLDHLQSPSNVGAIVRNAVAFGADFVMLSAESCDPFHPEAIRAMAGNWYQIPLFIGDVTEAVRLWNTAQWLVLDSHGTQMFNDVPLGVPTVVVIGSEGQGIVTPALQHLGRESRVVIPMRSGIESLNAAVSSGIMLQYLMQDNRKE